MVRKLCSLPLLPHPVVLARLNVPPSHLIPAQWLENEFANASFPMYDPSGQPWGEVERLSISGQARIMGAMRLRQVRSDTRKCKVSRSVLVEGTSSEERLCQMEYSFNRQSRYPIHEENSSEWEALLDFTRP